MATGEASSALAPANFTDRLENVVVVRLAVVEDLAEVKESISDTSGVGSGMGDDQYLYWCFTQSVKNPDHTVLFAANADGQGLGIMTIVWASAIDSYWESLRVGSAARRRGVAALLFRYAAQIAVAKQGEASVGRWGIVSSNDLMIDWGRRLALEGPLAYRRHVCTAAAADAPPPVLPAGHTVRTATLDDLPAFMAALAAFPLHATEHSTLNILRNGWGALTELELAANLRGEPVKGLVMPKPLLLLDADGRIRGLCYMGIMPDIPLRAVNPKIGATDEKVDVLITYHTDAADADAYVALIEAMPHHCRELQCWGVGGYVPSIDWLLKLFEDSPTYSRATDTEQWIYHWKNVEHV